MQHLQYLKVHGQRWMHVCVREREAFSLDLAMPNPISFWLLPGNITLTARNGQRGRERARRYGKRDKNRKRVSR